MMAGWFRLRLTGPDPVGFVPGNMVRRTDGIAGVWLVESTRVTKDRLELAMIALDGRYHIELPFTSLKLVQQGGDAYDKRGRK
jgi:hypothetical protein